MARPYVALDSTASPTSSEWQAWLRLLRLLHPQRQWEEMCASLGRDLAKLTGARQIVLYQQLPGSEMTTQSLVGQSLAAPGHLPKQVGELADDAGVTSVMLYEGPTQSIWLVFVEPTRGNLSAVLPYVAGELGHLLATATDFSQARSRLIDWLSRPMDEAGFSTEALLGLLVEALSDALGDMLSVAVADEGSPTPRVFVKTSGSDSRVVRLEDDELNALFSEAIANQRELVVRQRFAARLGQLVVPDEMMVDWFYFLPIEAGQYFSGLIGVGLPQAHGYPTTVPKGISASWGQDVSGLPKLGPKTMTQLRTMHLLRALAPELDDFVGRKALHEEAYTAGMQRESTFLGLDIHDSLLQDLSYVQLQLGRVQRMLTEDPKQAEALLNHIQAHVSMTSQSARELSVGLTSLAASSDLDETIHTVVDRFRTRFEGDVEVLTSGERRNVSARVGGHLKRILQESLNNVGKHSEATRVTAELAYSARGVRLMVKDNGRGFEAGEASPEHLGLRGMERRIKEARGILAIESTPGRGTSINVEIPT